MADSTTKTTCGATTRAGTPCKQRAGWGTDHPGEGHCKLHEGSVPGGADHTAGHTDDTTHSSSTWKDLSGCAIGSLTIGAVSACSLSGIVSAVGLVSAVWLVVKGEWWILGGGAIAMVVMPLVYPLAMLPSLPFTYGAAYLVKRRKLWAAVIVALPGCVYQAFAGVIWAAVVFFVVVGHAHPGAVIPAAIWGFGVAVAPLSYMMGRSQSPSDSSWIGVMLATIAYWTMGLLYWLGASAGSLQWALLSLTALGTILTVINFWAYAPEVEVIDPARTASAPGTPAPPLAAAFPTGHARGSGSASDREQGPTMLATEPPSTSGDLLCDAARLGDVAGVRRLLARGAGVDANDKEGWAPLHHAAGEGHGEVVELLLERGAEIDTPGYHPSTPLHWAALGGHREMVELLLERGAEVNAVNSMGGIPLQVAALEGYREVATLLLGHGADLNAKDNQGLTALHMAAMEGHREMVELLLERGADLDAKDIEGMTALQRATSREHPEVAVLLIECGANLDAKDSRRLTPLHMAAFWGHLEVVKLLLECGADLDAKDIEGMTALQRATSRGHREVAVLLMEWGAEE